MGNIDLEFEYFDIRKKINSLFESVIVQAEMKKLKVTIDINQNIPKKCY